MVAGLATLLGATPPATAESQSLDIYPGQDLAAIVNADPATTATTFYVHDQNGDPHTYNASALLRLSDGDSLIGDTGTFIERGPAFDPQPTVNIVGDAGAGNVIRTEGTVHIAWVKIVGGTGQYSDGSPVAGTGTGLAMGKASDSSSVYAVHVTGSDAAGISNAHGTFDSIELEDTTRDPNFLGFTGSGLKAITEVEVRNSYVHDNQGNGLWCDEYCNDSASHEKGFWIHDNLVVDNGLAGIRYEKVGDLSTAGEALIERNGVHGNTSDVEGGRGGVDIRDAQDALVRDNVFGAAIIAGVAYPANGAQLAVRATDSGRSDRPDLRNVDIVDNALNGEKVQGCELPDEVVACSQNAAPETTIDSGPESVVNGASASFGFSSSATGSTFECSLDGAPPAECDPPKEYEGLQDGGHTFGVRAVDAGGTADPTPASFTWTVDTVAPEAPAITSPEDNSHNNTGSITLSGSAEPGSSVEIFDGTASKGAIQADGSGAWSVTLGSVPNGPHAYTATGTDAATNTSPPSNTRMVIVDTTAPRVTSTVPIANVTGVSPTTNATAKFSEDMDASTINSTAFMLFKKGSTKKLAAAVSYSASTDTATLDPTSTLQSGATYNAVVSTGAKDLAGNSLDQNSSSAGLQEMAWFFTVRK